MNTDTVSEISTRNPTYTISTVTHNSLELVQRYFSSLLANTPLGEVEIIISDNGSKEPVVTYVRSLIAQGHPIRLISRPVGIGYLRGQNRALPYFRGKWLVLLNPSTSVPTGWLQAMRAEFDRNPKLGICGVEGTCWSLTPQCGGHPGKLREYVETSCAMIPMEIIGEIGLYDEGYRLGYCEDVDFSFRIRDRGYELAWANINVNYIRGRQWAKSEKEEGIDISGALLYNQKRTIQKWSRYFERRNFKQFVLIKRRGAVGDVLMTTPIIREIKRQHAHWDIDVQTDVPRVFDRNPDVRQSSPNLPPSGYDHIFDLNDAYENRPGRKVVDCYAEVCGIKVSDYREYIYPSGSDREWAKKICPQEPFAVLYTYVPTAVVAGRNWPSRYLDSVSQNLRSRGIKIALVGRPTDNPTVTHDIDLRGAFSLHQMAAAIERAKVVVGVDSLPAHLAAIAGVPYVVVAGGFDPRLTHQESPRFRYVRDERLECLGCHHIFPVPNHGSPCLRPRLFCMENVTPEMVLKAVDEVTS